jgi:uncharacterized membrane protein YhdT
MRHFGMVEGTGLLKYSVKVTFNCMISRLRFIKRCTNWIKIIWRDRMVILYNKTLFLKIAER